MGFNAENPRVAIVLLNYNGWRHTVACLRRLEELDYPDYQIMVVDNCSTDGSAARLGEAFPHLPIQQQGENRGFAAGNNVAIVRAIEQGFDFVWLLNNDTQAASDSLRKMVDLARRDACVGAVGCQLRQVDPSHRVQAFGGGRVHYWLGVSRYCRRPVPVEKLDYLTGASLLLRREALEAVGLLDEGFFMYWEDADLGIRLRRAGWKFAVAADAVVYHHESASLQNNLSRRDVLACAGGVRFFRRYAPFPLAPILIGACIRSLKRLLVGQPSRVWEIWSATLSALRRKDEPLRQPLVESGVA